MARKDGEGSQVKRERGTQQKNSGGGGGGGGGGGEGRNM